MTRPGAASRPARPATWVSNWKVRSAARKSGRCRPTSATTTPTSRTPGKSCPLATIWVPTTMSMLLSWRPRSTFLREPPFLRGVAIESGDARVRELAADLFFESLCSHAHECRIRCATFRTAIGRRNLEVAVVAAQAAVSLAWYTNAMSQFLQCSVAPHSKQRIAVEKPRRLRKRMDWPPSASVSVIARRSGVERMTLRPRGERSRSLTRSTISTAGRGRPPMRLGSTSRFTSPHSAAMAGVEGRCGRAQDDRAAGLCAAPTGEFSRVVAESLVVLVRRVVLFVDHDHAQVLEGCEECGLRAPTAIGVAPAPQQLPLFESLAGPQPAVEHGEFVTEAPPQTREDLMGEGDFRNQHECLPPGAKRFADSAQVDLGLAASRDAVEQEGLGA